VSEAGEERGVGACCGEDESEGLEEKGEKMGNEERVVRRGGRPGVGLVFMIN